MTQHQIIDPYIRRRLYARQNGKCAYCGQHRNHKYMTISHIIPLSRGGTDDISNLRCVCKKCNGMKDNMLPSEFARHTWTMFVNSVKIWLFPGKAV